MAQVRHNNDHHAVVRAPLISSANMEVAPLGHPSSEPSPPGNTQSPIALHFSRALRALRQCYQMTMTRVHMEMTEMSGQRASIHQAYIIRALRHLQECYQNAAAIVNGEVFAMLKEAAVSYQTLQSANVHITEENRRLYLEEKKAAALRSENEKLRRALLIVVQHNKQLKSELNALKDSESNRNQFPSPSRPEKGSEGPGNECSIPLAASDIESNSATPMVSLSTPAQHQLLGDSSSEELPAESDSDTPSTQPFRNVAPFPMLIGASGTESPIFTPITEDAELISNTHLNSGSLPLAQHQQSEKGFYDCGAIEKSHSSSSRIILESETEMADSLTNANHVTPPDHCQEERQDIILPNLPPSSDIINLSARCYIPHAAAPDGHKDDTPTAPPTRVSASPNSDPEISTDAGTSPAVMQSSNPLTDNSCTTVVPSSPNKTESPSFAAHRIGSEFEQQRVTRQRSRPRSLSNGVRRSPSSQYALHLVPSDRKRKQDKGDHHSRKRRRTESTSLQFEHSPPRVLFVVDPRRYLPFDAARNHPSWTRLAVSTDELARLKDLKSMSWHLKKRSEILVEKQTRIGLELRRNADLDLEFFEGEYFLQVITRDKSLGDDNLKTWWMFMGKYQYVIGVQEFLADTHIPCGESMLDSGLIRLGLEHLGLKICPDAIDNSSAISLTKWLRGETG